jgi:hypothetical protein
MKHENIYKIDATCTIAVCENAKVSTQAQKNKDIIRISYLL